MDKSLLQQIVNAGAGQEGALTITMRDQKISTCIILIQVALRQPSKTWLKKTIVFLVRMA